jgi:hypothetical protein
MVPKLIDKWIPEFELEASIQGSAIMIYISTIVSRRLFELDPWQWAETIQHREALDSFLIIYVFQSLVRKISLRIVNLRSIQIPKMMSNAFRRWIGVEDFKDHNVRIRLAKETVAQIHK